MLERLEPRRLLNGVIEMRGASLAIEGTEFADSIEFARGAPEENLLRVLFNGTWHEFQRDRVTQVNISTLAGPDTIILGPLDIPSHIRGGKGDDTISGGNLEDVLDGQGGFDYVFGRDGADVITGGLQGDEMIGGAGDDVFHAGSAGDNDDTVTGGPGHDIVDYSARVNGIHVSVETEPNPMLVVDSIYPDVEVIVGGQGNDTIINATRFGIELRGGPGNDTIRGGSGNDTLFGGTGRDLLYGFGGRDSFLVNDGQADTLFGGSGGDSADADGLDVLNEIP